MQRKRTTSGSIPNEHKSLKIKELSLNPASITATKLCKNLACNHLPPSAPKLQRFLRFFIFKQHGPSSCLVRRPENNLQDRDRIGFIKNHIISTQP
jgi:hypothetical protein